MTSDVTEKSLTGEGWLGFRVSGAVLLAVAVLVGACDFEVTNPGPVQDEFLDNQQAFDAIVSGMARANSMALGIDGGIVKYVGGAMRENFPSGNQVNHGIDPQVEQGLFPAGDDRLNDPWDFAQNARFTAEAGIERMSGVLGGEAGQHPLIARAHMWAGFASRLLGENFCRVTFDGGEPQPGSAALERAEDHFTSAIEIGQAAGATETVRAAYGGRASVRVNLGNWDGAVADAGHVPTDFEFEAKFFNQGEEYYNMWAWAIAGTPFRSFSTWNTPYLDYYSETGDPRVPWTEGDQEFGNLARPCCGKVPFKPQQKFDDVTDAIDLTDGREMRLIESEALLRDGAWQEAFEIVNQLREDVRVDGREPGSLEEAWTMFRFEKGIELWLEGRRMADVRRWVENGVPGEFQPLEDPQNPQSYLSPNRDLCIPIPRSEQLSNPNVPFQ